MVTRSKRGLEVSLEEYPKLQIVGGGDFYAAPKQRFLLELFQGLLAEAQELNGTIIFSPFQGRTEHASKSKPFHGGIPSKELHKLDQAISNLETQKTSDCQSVKAVANEFRLPDPMSHDKFYRLYGPPWNRKLLILWGCQQVNSGDSVAPVDALRSLRKIANARFQRRRQKYARLLIVFLLLGGSAWGVRLAFKADVWNRLRHFAELFRSSNPPESPASSEQGPASPTEVVREGNTLRAKNGQTETAPGPSNVVVREGVAPAAGSLTFSEAFEDAVVAEQAIIQLNALKAYRRLVFAYGEATNYQSSSNTLSQALTNLLLRTPPAYWPGTNRLERVKNEQLAFVKALYFFDSTNAWPRDLRHFEQDRPYQLWQELQTRTNLATGEPGYLTEWVASLALRSQTNQTANISNDSRMEHVTWHQLIDARDEKKDVPAALRLALRLIFYGFLEKPPTNDTASGFATNFVSRTITPDNFKRILPQGEFFRSRPVNGLKNAGWKPAIVDSRLFVFAGFTDFCAALTNSFPQTFQFTFVPKTSASDAQLRVSVSNSSPVTVESVMVMRTPDGHLGIAFNGQEGKNYWLLLGADETKFDNETKWLQALNDVK